MSLFDSGYGRFNKNVSEDLVVSDGVSGFDYLEEKFVKKEKSVECLQLEVSQAIEKLKAPIEFSHDEVKSVLASVHELADEGASGVVDSILKPAFWGLADGALRAFKVPNKMGLTPSRIFKECDSFSYKDNMLGVNTPVDSFSEAMAAESDADALGSEQKYEDGKFIDRGGESIDVRSQASYRNKKIEHFGDSYVAHDEYDPDSTVTRSTQFEHNSAETDHIVPLDEKCRELGRNVALTRNDIAEIVNHEDNLAVTSCKTNRVKGKDNVEEYIKKHGEELSDAQKENMRTKDRQARKTLDREVNKKVLKNIKGNRDVQKDLAGGAAKNAAAQIGGNIILYILKPFWYEMKDSIANGLKKGVNAGSMKHAIVTRFSRMKEYILTQAKKLMTGESLNFLKAFVNMLLEAIISCFLGVMKMVFRLLKEGVKIVGDLVKILRDKKSSVAQKGDAILKLITTSFSVYIGIWIEGYIGQALPRPWSILLASLVSAGVLSGLLYILNKVDLFDVNASIRHQRVMDILQGMHEETDKETDEIIKRMQLSVSAVST